MVSSARNPNESYAQHAKKALGTPTTSLPTQAKQQQTTAAAAQAPSIKPPQVNVWAERIREQKAHAPPQLPAQAPRQRAISSPQPPREDAIQPRSPPPDISAQLAILDQQDEHDPFVVRIPPHLSRQSSSSTNPVPAADSGVWPHLAGADLHSNGAPSDSPALSAVPSRQNSSASFRHHAYSPSGSVRLPRVQSSLSQHSQYSASQSRTNSRSGSSASSPRLQFRGRMLPRDDPLPPDLRLDHNHRRSSNKRSSPPLPDPSDHISASFPPLADSPYYQRPPPPPLQDMSRYIVPPYALPPHYPHINVPGHASPPYIPPPSGQATPPYPHYPPYPVYMYGHSPLFWGDIPRPHSQNHVQNQPPISSIHVNTSEHAVPNKIDYGSISPTITTDPGASEHRTPDLNGWHSRPSKSVVFGTIGSAESLDDQSTAQPNDEQHSDAVVDHATEQFATFSIGLSPDQPGPSRLASRKSSSRSLSKILSSQPSTSDGAKDVNALPPPQEVNGVKKPIKWEFGTTHSDDLDDTKPPSSPPLPPALNHQPSYSAENVNGRPDSANISPSHDASLPDFSANSRNGSPTSDVWVVKDYGYGFGDYSGSGNAPDVARLEMQEREKEHTRTTYRQEMIRDQRSWLPPRQLGWRHENIEEGKEVRDQHLHTDAPRYVRPRRGSFPGYGGYERGGYANRRGRGFGRFHGGRGRVNFFHHHRPGSYPYGPPLPPPQPPFEVVPPAIDMVNGYGHHHYAQPELESYEVVSSASQPHGPFTPASYSADAMQNSLLTQLEYYLSPENMAQDFFLRQRMDSEGWIPISLLASFRRVQLLQTDADIVKKVLRRSESVEVNGDWVRMGGRQWVVFVLPSAPRSVVTCVDRGEDTNPEPDPRHDDDEYAERGETDGEPWETEGDYDGEDCDVDDEEDEIEFVIGEEAEGSWMPVPERKP